jgi:thymidylate synthase ThyX
MSNQIEVKIIADSISEGTRLTTLQLIYPRFFHSEFMTHRVFSRNASSSRAIPIAKMIEQVRTNPAMPIHWGKNQPGMQAKEEVANDALAKTVWLAAANRAAEHAEIMNELGLHKQVVNRILEPFQLIHVVVTATEWRNFFELRDHEDAQPEIRDLAHKIRVSMEQHTPREIIQEIIPMDAKLADINYWHLPYINDGEFTDPFLAARCSAARCARVSYMKHDGTIPSIEEDLKLYDRLINSYPMHASPVEHQAIPSVNARFHKNFFGWIQFRELLEKGYI